MIRPGDLAVRATGQYRTRDTLTYLGLRYYLDNGAAVTDRWVNEVATRLVLQRGGPSYHTAFHFKEIDDRGRIQRRPLSLPGPNEALAETALIQACADSGQQFARHASVYSYWPTRWGDRKGIFVDYIEGLRARHQAITEACRADPDAIVCMRDIKKFYPSIDITLARQHWSQACDASGLEHSYRELGNRLLIDHGLVGQGHLLVGPMFSHFIGNLFLRNMDERMQDAPARYMRYVDDVALVGTASQVSASLEMLNEEIEKLGLALHDKHSPKSLDISREDWIQGESDFDGSGDWMSLIGDIKKLLLWRPADADNLRVAMSEAGMRLPLPDYSIAVRETSFIDRALRLIGWDRYREGLRDISVESLVGRALTLRRVLDQQLIETLDLLPIAAGYGAKRLMTRSRYLSGRLMYVAETARLGQLYEALRTLPELTFQAEVASAISTRCIDGLIDLGVNAAQAASQPLRASAQLVTLTREVDEPWQRQAINIFAVNGVQVHGADHLANFDALSKFSMMGVDRNMMRDADPYARELACLHGLGGQLRHRRMMETAFDPAQDIALDAIEQARGSLSG